MTWAVLIVALVAVSALAGWLFDVGLWWGPPGLIAAFALTSVLSGLIGALTARVAGIRLDRVEIGAGGVVCSKKVGTTRLVFRRVPVTAIWIGAARTRSRLRLRFWVAHLGFVLAVVGVIALLTRLPDGDVRRGAVVGATLALILDFLPSTDERGHRSGGGWQLLTIPFLSESALVGWFVTEQVATAMAAVDRGDLDRAEVLLREALAEDPGQASAWMQLSAVLFDSGRFVEAVEVTSEMLQHPDAPLPLRIGRLNNHAWALLVAAEAGTPVDAWRDRSRRALDEAEELAGAGNATLMSTRALYEALDGNAAVAISLARAALDEAFDAELRVEEMLTLAVAVSRVDDEAAVDEWLQAAVDLSPGHPRIPGVRRLVAAPEPRTGG